MRRYGPATLISIAMGMFGGAPVQPAAPRESHHEVMQRKYREYMRRQGKRQGNIAYNIQRRKMPLQMVIKEGDPPALTKAVLKRLRKNARRAELFRNQEVRQMNLKLSSAFGHPGSDRWKPKAAQHMVVDGVVA